METTICDTPPEGAAAGAAYSLVTQVLVEVGKVGIGKLIFRERESPSSSPAKGSA